MTITPVILALISTGAAFLGAVIGAVATLWSASLTQRATRDRETEFKVWERRADAIEEAHRKMLALGNTRDLAWARRQVPSNLSPEDLDPDHQPEQFRLVVTKLTLYTTSELVQAYRESNAAFLKSLMAIQSLELAQRRTGGPLQFNGREVHAEHRTAEQAVRESKAADDRLVAALLEAATLAATRRRRREPAR